MLLNLQKTCIFLHREISSFIYTNHVFYFNTPARLANFTRCLAFGPVAPRDLGTIILEVRTFYTPHSIYNLHRFFNLAGEPELVVERGSSLSVPYEDLKELRASNPHFMDMRNKETLATQDWNGWSYGPDWAVAVLRLVKHKIKKLIIKSEYGAWPVWTPTGGLLTALRLVGDSGNVKEVVVDFGQDIVPHQVFYDVAMLKAQYGWK